MFRIKGILPDEVGRQDPRALIEMLEGLNDEEGEYTGNDPYLKMFYGQ